VSRLLQGNRCICANSDCVAEILVVNSWRARGSEQQHSRVTVTLIRAQKSWRNPLQRNAHSISSKTDDDSASIPQVKLPLALIYSKPYQYSDLGTMPSIRCSDSKAFPTMGISSKTVNCVVSCWKCVKANTFDASVLIRDNSKSIHCRGYYATSVTLGSYLLDTLPRASVLQLPYETARPERLGSP
jgi:hypothetical protein